MSISNSDCKTFSSRSLMEGTLLLSELEHENYE
jgi:hypothetical protein